MVKFAPITVKAILIRMRPKYDHEGQEYASNCLLIEKAIWKDCRGSLWPTISFSR